jgi:copper chaperone
VGGYFLDNRLRRLIRNPEKIVGFYIGRDMIIMDIEWAIPNKVRYVPCRDWDKGDNGSRRETLFMSVRQSLLYVVLTCLVACVFGCGQQDSPPAKETREFAIEGMSCEGCVNTITSALKAVSGVKSVEVSLEDKKATVVADSSKVSSETIEDTVAKAGYKARLITAVGSEK